MRTVLVTGSSGQVGSVVLARLEDAGLLVRGFDLFDGADLRDEQSVRRAACGCDAVVHAGAIAHDRSGTAAEIMATNVLGTWHVLLAAEAARMTRVVYLSSAQVFGFAEGEGTPAYRPVDDAHPLRAARPYGLSKRLAEELCAAWSGRTDIPTVILRPVLILSDATLAGMTPEQADLGAFVHVVDVAEAIVQALAVDLDGCHRLTLCGPGDYDTTLARRILQWQPQDAWPN